MAREIKNRIEFTVMCINAFSAAHSLSSYDGYICLKEFGGIALLKDCYDAMHLQSIADAVDDLTALLKRQGWQAA